MSRITYLPETEARKKWCPFGPTHHTPPEKMGGYDVANTEVDVPKSRSRCIATACMAWREEAGQPTGRGYATYSGDGYCGLVGKP